LISAETIPYQNNSISTTLPLLESTEMKALLLAGDRSELHRKTYAEILSYLIRRTE